ncbi:MAG TPA: cysteine desulfurase-like protein [Blastocatellia bacterium]|nr:cysteine desulfurase-like protein [Blastocatellia bacterium]
MPDNKVATTAEIRSHFPALERIHNGYPVAYFDGPGGTQVPREVVDAVTDYLLHHNSNTHWSYPTSRETDQIIADSRAALANFLNAEPNEIVFGANMTTLAFHLARALGRGFKSGDEIIVTELDHHGNRDPWRSLVQERGAVLRELPMNLETGQLEIDELKGLINDRTRLIAIGGASNALGTVNDISRAAQIARATGVLSFIDAVHYAPHVLVDVKEIGCDFLACSAYKFYGPHIGVLYGRTQLLAEIDFPKLIPAPNTAPDRVETGTQNHEGIAGAAAAVNFLASLASTGTRRERLAATFDVLHQRGQSLVTRLWNGLMEIDGVKVYGPSPSHPRTPTVSFTKRGKTAQEMAIALAERGLFVSHGNFYAAMVVERLGKADEGLVRIGCACYTSEDEIERLLDAVRII